MSAPSAQGQIHGPVTLASAAVASGVVIVLVLGPQWVLVAALLPWVVGLAMVSVPPTRPAGVGVIVAGFVLPAVFLALNGYLAFFG